MFTEKFDSFVCMGEHVGSALGDSINTSHNGIDYTASIIYDSHSHIDDWECYSQEWIDSWKRNEWHFCGVVISASKNGVFINDHLASLWGVECNLPLGGNSYLLDVANELLPEAIEIAEEEIKEMVKKLAA